MTFTLSFNTAILSYLMCNIHDQWVYSSLTCVHWFTSNVVRWWIVMFLACARADIRKLCSTYRVQCRFHFFLFFLPSTLLIASFYAYMVYNIRYTYIYAILMTLNVYMFLILESSGSSNGPIHNFSYHKPKVVDFDIFE